MSQYLYAFDPYGTNAANVITESRTLPVTALKVIIPYFAPFFTKGIVIKQGTKVLKEGVDFYFGHRYVTGQHQTAQRMCGSIWIINRALTGPFAITYRTLGDQYSVTKARATQYLAETLAEPISETWEDVLGSEPYFPPVDIQFDKDNFIWEPNLVAAIDAVSTAIINQDPTDDDFHRLAVELITHLEGDVNTSNYAAHLAARGPVHGETYYSAGALHEDGIAQNTSKLSDVDRATLTAQVLAAADLTSELVKKFPLAGDRTMEANLILRDSLASIARSAGGKKTQVLDLSNGNGSSVAENDFSVIADKSATRPGVLLTIESGNNKLTIESTGNITDDRAMKFNGMEVITKGSLAAYAAAESSYGALDYLPIPVTGDFKAAGFDTGMFYMFPVVEEDGRLVYLRNAADEFYQSVYYGTAKISPAGVVTDVNPTTIPYRHASFGNDLPISIVAVGSDMCIIKTTGAQYIVKANGTLDPAKNTVAKVVGLPELGVDHRIALVGNFIYVFEVLMTNGGTVSLKGWRAAAAGLVQGGTMTFNAINIGGNDLFGRAMTASTEAILCSQAGTDNNDPNWKGLWYRKSGDYGVSLPHAGPSYLCEVSGNSVRFAISFGVWLSRPTGGFRYPAGGEYTFKLAFKLNVSGSSHAVAIEKANQLPMAIDGSDVIYNGDTWQTNYQVNHNFRTVMYSTADFMFFIRSWGTVVAPGCGVVKPPVGKTAYDFAGPNAGAAVYGSQMSVMGNHPSPLRSFFRHWHPIGNDYAVVKNKSTDAVLLKYVPGGKFVDGILGHGPTNDRVAMATSVYNEYVRVPVIHENGVVSPTGFIFTEDNLSGSSEIAVTTLRRPMSMSAAVMAALKAQLITDVNGRGVDIEKAGLSLYYFRRAGIKAIAVLSALHKEAAAGVGKTLKGHVFTVDITLTGDVVTVASKYAFVGTYDIQGYGLDVVEYGYYGGSSLAKLADGNWAAVLNLNASVAMVGDNQSRAVVLTGNGTTWNIAQVRTTHGSAIDTVMYDPLYGVMENRPSPHGETLFSTIIGKTKAEIDAWSGPTSIVHMTRPATGWTMIFTATVLAVINNQEHTFPMATFDIKAMFPTAHQNKTFYVYAMVENGVPKYLIDPRQLNTTRTRLMIGYLRTDSERIVEIYITARGSVSKPVTRDSATMMFSGNGNGTSPLTVTVPMKDASSAEMGLAFLLQDGSAGEGPRAVSQKAVTDAQAQLAGLVPITRKVAGKPLSSDIVLDSGSFGLDQVDNISDEDMPLNQNHYTELEDAVATNHTHTATDIVVTDASLTKTGVTQFAREAGTSETLAISSDFIVDLQRQASNLEREASLYLPDDVLSISRYGTYSYLPVPAQGNYPAAGIGSGTAVGEMEDDGTLVLLRNGGDAISKGVYYAYAKFDAAGKVSKFTPTTMEYTPPGLPEGARVDLVFRGSEGVFTMRDTLGNKYIVLTGGTMDFSKHRIVKIPSGPDVANLDVHPVIAGGRVCIIQTAMSNGGLITVSLWTIALSIIDENTTEVVPQSIPLGGTDLYGNVIAPTSSFKFTPVGSSFSAADQPLAHFTDNTWTNTRNVRHSSNDFDVIARGDKIRVLNVVQSYFSNAGWSSSAEWPMSFVIDITTRDVVHEYDGPMPIVVDSAGIHPKRFASPESCGFGSAGGNAFGQVIRSKGRTFAFASYGTEWIPRLAAVKQVNTTRDEFDDYHMDLRSATTLSSTPVIGNYGSDLHGGLKCIRMVEGSRVFGKQADGNILFEYDPNGTFGPDGYGPTMNRVMKDAAFFDKITRMPSIIKDGLISNRGFIFTDIAQSGDGQFAGNDFSVPMSIDAAVWAGLKAAVQQWRDGLGIDPNYMLTQKVMLYVTPETDIPPLVVYYFSRWQDNNKLVKGRHCAVFEASVTRRTGNVGAVTLGTLINSKGPEYGLSSLNDDYYIRVGTHYGKMDDGRWWMALNDGPGMPNVGSSAFTNSPVLVYNVASKTWEYVGWSTPSYHSTDGLIYTPEFGACSTARDSTAEAVYADARGKTLAEWVTGNSTRKVLSMTRVLEGWSVYFTEEVQAIMAGSQWKFPKVGYDLKTLFPGAQANSTFYIYADVTTGTARYTFSKTELVESSQRIYVGYCKTGVDRITELRVDAVTSITNFRELEDHVSATDVHGIDAYTKESLGYGKVSNYAPQFELANVGFSDVFNSWSRFSHQAANWNQPANAAELNAWSYDAATDTIRCTINSVTYIGFVSNTEVGDFNFDVEVGLPLSSTDGDNDAITLVIAFKTKDGREHTLNVVRSGSIETHVKATTLFGVYYDYQLPDQLQVAAVDTGETPFPWRGRYARIRVTRRGDAFTVASTDALAQTWASAVDADFKHVIQFTLNDRPELALFKGVNRFGYGSLSQLDSSYRAYVRPDVDDAGHYATAGAVLKELYWQQNITMLKGTVVDGGVVPLPAGFAAKETMTFLYPSRRVEGDPIAYRPLVGIGVSFNETTRVATGKAKYSGGEDPIEMAYYVLAMPSGNFLKK